MKKKHFLLPVIIFVLLISLSVTQQASAQTSLPNVPVNPPTAEVVPGEIIVKYKDGQAPEDLEKAVERRKQNEKVPFVGKLRNYIEDFRSRQRGDKPPEEKLQQQKNVEQQVKVVDTDEITPKDQTLAEKENLDDIQFIKTSPQISSQTLEKLYESLSQVDYVVPNYKIYPDAIQPPNDPKYSEMWNLTSIKAPEAWEITTGSQQVTVAVLDTGIYTTHEDLPPNIGGYDFGDNDSDPSDFVGHGTHVAGTIGAATNNGKGVSGINWNVTLMSVKVFSAFDGGTTIMLLRGILYAADNGADVINMSLAGPFQCVEVGFLQDVIDYARAKGVTIVVSAGNSGVDASYQYPASCNGVIVVGSVDQDDERSIFRRYPDGAPASSNFGSIVDIAAPGGSQYKCSSGNWSSCLIYSTVNYNPWYEFKQGTSMAAPHVAGAAALLLSVKPSLTPDEVETILKTSADQIYTDYPIGKRLNVYNALLSVLNTPLPPTPTLRPTRTPTPSPTPHPFGLSMTPTAVSVTIQVGSSVKAFDLTSTTATSFQLSGNDLGGSPTSYGVGIGWEPKSGNITPGSSIPISIKVDANVPPSTYGGTGWLENPLNPTPLTFPVNVLVTSNPSLTPAQLRGDINKDNKVDLADYSIWRCEFLGSGTCINPPSTKTSDLDGDGQVNLLDYMFWRNAYVP